MPPLSYHIVLRIRYNCFHGPLHTRLSLFELDRQIHAHSSGGQANPLFLAHAHAGVVSLDEGGVHALSLQVSYELLGLLQLAFLAGGRRAELVTDALLERRRRGELLVRGPVLRSSQRSGGLSDGELAEQAPIERRDLGV